jgi:nucleoside-diphosphate-sugar epimerase
VRILLAGASGLIGVRLVPLLVAGGHEVAGITRSAGKLAGLAALGAEPLLCDVYDVERLRSVTVAFRPELVMHQLTDLPDDRAELERADTASANARVRREGTANLIAAATAAGCRRLIAQSVAWELAGDGGAAKAELERSVLEFGGVVVRYGQFYGPGTYHPERRPRPPCVHIDEAARRTAELLDAESGIVTIVEE